jgi:hypothetical protein
MLDARRARKQLKQASEETKNGETHIFARGYLDILQHSDFSFYLTVFSGVLPQTKNRFQIM